MPLTLLRHAVQKPLIGPTKLDMDHTLARSLGFAFLFNEGSGSSVWDPVRLTQQAFGSQVTWAQGPSGPVLSLPGTSGQGATGTDFPLTNGGPWTVSFKYMLQVDASHFFFDTGAQSNEALLHLQDAAAAGWGVNLWNDDRVMSFPKQLNTWLHGHLTQTPDKVLTLYINGVSQATSTALAMFLGTTAFWEFGNRGTDYWTGLVDHFMFWTRALTAAEVWQHAVEPYAMFQTRPLQRWLTIPLPAPPGMPAGRGAGV